MAWLHPRHPAIRTIRLFVAAVFLFYGVVKLSGGQYYYGDWTITKSERPGTSLVWAFYGYSPFYGRVTGLFEAVPALLLLFRRTSLVGAGALFAVGLNITLMDFAFGFPSVKWFALLYTLLCVVLVLAERDKLRAVFAAPEPGGRAGRRARGGGGTTAAGGTTAPGGVAAAGGCVPSSAAAAGGPAAPRGVAAPGGHPASGFPPPGGGFSGGRREWRAGRDR